MLQTSNVCLSINQRQLITDLNWQVLRGECWCVIGPNGGGKTTLLRTLAGLRAPDQGTVALGGRALSAWQAEVLARERTFLPQVRNDAFGYSVMETVLTARHPYHHAHYWESDTDHKIAQNALARVDAMHLAGRDIRTLSGGERQRVAIAAALAQDTPFLLLDEPANALDLAHQVGIMRLLKALCRQEDKAVVLVSHDLNLAHGAASHALLLLGNGQWQAGPISEVMQPSLLSRCLGYPIELVRHGNRIIYVPAEENNNA